MLLWLGFRIRSYRELSLFAWDLSFFESVSLNDLDIPNPTDFVYGMLFTLPI